MPNEIEEKFLTKKKFSTQVEQLARSSRIPYLDAVVSLCEELNVEPVDAAKLISKVLKEKIEAEAIDLNYIKGGNKLPL